MEQKIGNIFGFTGGNYAGNVYDKDHLSPTLNTMQGGYKQPMIIDDTYTNRQPRVYEDYSPALRSEREGLKTIEVKQLGFMDSGTGKHQSNTVYDEKSLCPNITTIDGGGTQQIKVMTENLYDFYNDKMKQDGICGTLTTGTSHNGSGTFGIVETINKVGQISNDGSQYGTVIADNRLSPNLVAGTHGYANSCIATQYRIRKLTPRECWRLMDFSDEDFEKAAEVNSNTQLYKQAGNSIVVNVLVAILGQLLPGKENVYKELSECE